MEVLKLTATTQKKKEELKLIDFPERHAAAQSQSCCAGRTSEFQ